MFSRQPVYRVRGLKKTAFENYLYQKNLKIVTKFNVYINLELPHAFTALFRK